MGIWNPYKIISDETFESNLKALSTELCRPHGSRRTKTLPERRKYMLDEYAEEIIFSLDQVKNALHKIQADPDTLFKIGAAASRLEETRDFIMKSRGIGYSHEAAAIHAEDIEEQERVRNQKVL